MPNYTLTISGRRVVTGVLEIEKPQVQLYMFKEDQDIFGGIRSCASCPAVMVMKEDSHAQLTKQWQYYLRAINYNMSVGNVYLLLDDHLAFANNTGFPGLDNPGDKQDWFFNRNLGINPETGRPFKPPALDKVRTMSRSVLTGVEEYDYPTFTYDGRNSLIQRITSFLGIRSKEPVLNVKVFDSRQLPPLKPGYSYPRDISEVDHNAYAIMPETHPEMFLVANIVNRRGEVVQFPRGATYPWIDGGRTPYSFVPHIANLGYGPIKVPMRYLYKVPLGSPKPRPYRP
jgi:hypothetical protein